MARLESFAANMRSLGFKVDVSDLDLRKVSRFLNGEIRKVERVKKTAIKRAGGRVRQQLIGAVKGKGAGYRIAGPHPARSELHDILHGRDGGVGAPFGIGDPRSVEIELRGSDSAVIGWKKPSLRSRVERFQDGTLSGLHFRRHFQEPFVRHALYRRVFHARPELGKGKDPWRLPIDYVQPDRPVVEPIQRNAREKLGGWIEGALKSMLRKDRAGDLATAALGAYLKDGEDFR